MVVSMSEPTTATLYVDDDAPEYAGPHDETPPPPGFEQRVDELTAETRLPRWIVAALHRAGLKVPTRDTVDRIGFTFQQDHAIAAKRGTAQREPKPPREGAASKDGEMMCVGLDGNSGCGETKPVTKFPTTTGGNRATECRECRDKRRGKK